MKRLLLLSVFWASAPALASSPKVASHVCPDGLTVLVAENHSLPLVTVEIAAKNGSMTESPAYNGLSHLYEHMFFKANAKLPSQEAYLARIRELGIQFNGTTNTERVNYFFTTTTDHFSDAMGFMHDAIVSPLFDAKELKRERVVVTGEIDRNEANPYYHLSHAVEQKVWWKYPSRKDPLGNRKTVLSATPAMMRTIQHRYYVPNNSVLVVSGDVKADAVFAQADALYTDWPRAADPFVKYPLVKHPAIPRPEVVLVQQPGVQTFTGEWVWQGPSTVGPSVPSTYAADLLAAAIGQPSSKFQKDLVDSGACVSANMSWYTQENVGPITFFFEAAPDKVDTCISAVRAELPRMKQADYLSDEELTSAAHTLDVGQVQDRETSSGFAHALTFWWTSAGLGYYDQYIPNVEKVTRADLAAYLDQFVLGKPYVFGALVSPEMAKVGLTQAHLEEVAGITPVHTTSKQSKEAVR